MIRSLDGKDPIAIVVKSRKDVRVFCCKAVLFEKSTDVS